MKEVYEQKTKMIQVQWDVQHKQEHPGTVSLFLWKIGQITEEYKY